MILSAYISVMQGKEKYYIFGWELNKYKENRNMRKLTKKQKELLDVWCVGNFDIGGFNGAKDVDTGTWNKLRELNDTGNFISGSK